VQDYPPPDQRPIFEGAPPRASRVVDMNNPGVEQRIVRDVLGDLHTSWRWTSKSPAVQIPVRTNQPLNYTIDFAIAGITLKDTGPVTITFLVNNHELGRERYDTEGPRHFERAVPAEWVVVGHDAIVGAEIDKVWTSKSDGTQLGFILSRIGLTPR
jgi:hypothetical protein